MGPWKTANPNEAKRKPSALSQGALATRDAILFQSPQRVADVSGMREDGKRLRVYVRKERNLTQDRTKITRLHTESRAHTKHLPLTKPRKT